jgi:flagellar FliL protein
METPMPSLFPLLLLALLLSAPLQANERPPIYYAMEPAFVVNIQDGPRPRFMQVKLQLMTRDQKLIASVEKNLPPIRHAMILLLSSQDGETMRNTAAREQVRLQALDALQQTLAEVAGVQDGLEAVYFTDLVIQ